MKKPLKNALSTIQIIFSSKQAEENDVFWETK